MYNNVVKILNGRTSHSWILYQEFKGTSAPNNTMNGQSIRLSQLKELMDGYPLRKSSIKEKIIQHLRIYKPCLRIKKTLNTI